MKSIAQGFLLVVAICIFVYASYEIGKLISYDWWYEDMVKTTIREMVKPEALKDSE